MYRSAVRAACSRWTPSTYHYKSRRPGQAALEQRVREICQTRVRYGYRRIHVLLRRVGWCHGQKKTRRVYRELGPVDSYLSHSKTAAMTTIAK